MLVKSVTHPSKPRIKLRDRAHLSATAEILQSCCTNPTKYSYLQGTDDFSTWTGPSPSICLPALCSFSLDFRNPSLSSSSFNLSPRRQLQSFQPPPRKLESRIQSSRQSILPSSSTSPQTNFIDLAIAAILPPSTGLVHDHLDPNAPHSPSQSSRHTLNPTGARARESEELGDFNYRSVKGVSRNFLPPTVVADRCRSIFQFQVPSILLLLGIPHSCFSTQSSFNNSYATGRLSPCLDQPSSPPRPRRHLLPYRQQRPLGERSRTHRRGSTSASTVLELLVGASIEAGMNVLVCVTLNELVSGRKPGSSAQFLVFLGSVFFMIDNVVPMLHKLGSVNIFPHYFLRSRSLTSTLYRYKGATLQVPKV